MNNSTLLDQINAATQAPRELLIEYISLELSDQTDKAELWQELFKRSKELKK